MYTKSNISILLNQIKQQKLHEKNIKEEMQRKLNEKMLEKYDEEDLEEGEVMPTPEQFKQDEDEKVEDEISFNNKYIFNQFKKTIDINGFKNELGKPSYINEQFFEDDCMMLLKKLSETYDVHHIQNKKILLMDIYNVLHNAKFMIPSLIATKMSCKDLICDDNTNKYINRTISSYYKGNITLLTTNEITNFCDLIINNLFINYDSRSNGMSSITKINVKSDFTDYEKFAYITTYESINHTPLTLTIGDNFNFVEAHLDSYDFAKSNHDDCLLILTYMFFYFYEVDDILIYSGDNYSFLNDRDKQNLNINEKKLCLSITYTSLSECKNIILHVKKSRMPVTHNNICRLYYSESKYDDDKSEFNIDSQMGDFNFCKQFIDEFNDVINCQKKFNKGGTCMSQRR